jgi:hypothetical protein
MTNDDSYVDLYWIPVGAGTRVQRASLVLYEALAAAVSRRPRVALVHAGVKLGLDRRRYTFELMPAPPGPNPDREVTGPVGVRLAGRLRIFRYRACLVESDSLPDEEWTIGEPVRVSLDPDVVRRVVDLRRDIPAYTWGRRRRGHSEMWTSDSAVSWLLGRAGIDVGSIEPPAGARAPGWRAGIEELSL